MFPPEPPVTMTHRPERRAVVKGAPLFGAAQRTLECEHRSGTQKSFDGRRSGNMIPLVGFEQGVGDRRADDSPVASATIDHTDMRGSKPQGHDPSGAASD
jgi:hypothetical protein